MGTSAPLLFPKYGGSSPALPHAVSCLGAGRGLSLSSRHRLKQQFLRFFSGIRKK